MLLVLLPMQVHAQDAFCEWDRTEAAARFGSSALSAPTIPAWTLPLSQASFARRSAPGRVFPSDPGSSVPTDVLLPGLLGDGMALDGEYVRAGSDRLDGIGQVMTTTDGDFRFAPDTSAALLCPTDISVCRAFDAVNVYWHVDRYVREFWVDRMGVEPSFRAEARVHIGGDGAFADWTSRSQKMGVGDIFMKNTALSDDLIYHEYTHLVLSSLGFETGTGVSEQTRALHEAYADYFAATFTGEPRIGEWVVTCPPRQQCQGPPNDRELRTLELDPGIWNWREGAPSDSLRYGICTRFHEGDGKCKQSWNNYTRPYVWGMIWAAALWDLRTALGAEQVDRLALEAARRHDSTTDFARALGHLLEEAEGRFGPNVRGQVETVFLERGLTASMDVSVESSDQDAGLELWPNPARGSLSIRLPDAPSGHLAAEWVIRDLLGREVLRGTARSGDLLSVDTGQLPAGVYRFEARSGARSMRQMFVHFR
ncbi:MAG: hypothetical protein O3C45_02930 [Bacteroidetes bacterium]|nr:hypothetical protein [Bacteroidota bacterium]